MSGTWAQCREWEEHQIFRQGTPDRAQLTGRLTCASRPIGDTTNDWTNSQGGRVTMDPIMTDKKGGVVRMVHLMHRCNKRGTSFPSSQRHGMSRVPLSCMITTSVEAIR